MLHIKGTAVLDALEAIKARAGKAELDKIISNLDPETREVFQRPISPSSWYSCDRRIAVHSTYFDGVQIIPEMKGPKSATIQYVGFPRNHRIMGFAIIGFFRKALEISGAKKIDVRFTVPIEAGQKFCELALTWD